MKNYNGNMIVVDEHGNASIKVTLLGKTHHVHLFYDYHNDEYCVDCNDVEFSSGSFSDAMAAYCDLFINFQSDIPLGLFTLLNDFQDLNQAHFDSMYDDEHPNMKLSIDINRYTHAIAVECFGAGGLLGLHKYADTNEVYIEYKGIEGAFDNYQEYIDSITLVIGAIMHERIEFKVNYDEVK